MILAAFVFVLPAFASEDQRKISSGIESESCVIYKSPGRVFDIEIVATVNGGYAVLYDMYIQGGATEDATGELAKSEIREATAYNSKHVNFGHNGIKFEKGIYLILNDATAIVHYH